MNLDTIVSLISTAALLYFAYGTWRIDRTLTKVERHLSSIRAVAEELKDADL